VTWTYHGTGHPGRYDLHRDGVFAGFIAVDPDHDSFQLLASIVHGMNHPLAVEDLQIGGAGRERIDLERRKRRQAPATRGGC
jgi:hypothetical protein